MENTLENKAKFFALYWGLEFTGSDHYGEYMPGTWSEYPKYVEKQYLILKPLSSISDDDAKELSLRLVNVVGWDNMIKKSSKELVKEIVGNYSRLNLIHLLPAMFIDKCRQLGYAVPVDDLLFLFS